MEQQQSKLIPDGTLDFVGGQDASKSPDRVGDNCYYSGINVSTRQGVLQPRWGFDRISEDYEDSIILDKYKRAYTCKELFEGGKYQGFCSYYVGTQLYLIFIISGHIFLVNPSTHTVSLIPIADGSTLNARASRVQWTAAGKYLVIYDFPNYPVILEGFNARRANPLKMEIPVSIMGAFNENRLFIANNGNGFTAGDPVGSLATPNAPITFEEIMTDGSPYLAQTFALPTTSHNDPITYMGFLQVADTSTGIGPLIIASDRALYSFTTQNPRYNWDQSQFGTVIDYCSGVAGPRAFVNVNSDAFYMSSDGYVRALSMSRNEQSRWSRVPISREVGNWFTTWDKDLTRLAFVSYFNNKIFFSVNPYRMTVSDFDTRLPISDYAHGGLVVMELDNIVTSQSATTGALSNGASPIWAGLWTGVRPMDMVVAQDRAFIISKDGGANRLYEVNPDVTYDTADDKIRYVRSRIYTKSYNFQDPFATKELHSINFNISEMQGEFSVDVKYKSFHSPSYIDWITFKHNAPWKTCDIPEDCFINGFAPHQIKDLILGLPETEECDPVTHELYRIFRKVQLMLTFVGKYWELHEVIIKAVPRVVSEQQTLCDKLPEPAVCAPCSDDWLIPEFEGCEEIL